MIQRIQTIYLFLAAIAALLAVVLSVPYAISGTMPLELNDFLPISIVSLAGSLLCLGNIFLYKNRILQINLCRLALLFCVVVVGMAIYFALITLGDDMPQAGASFPILSGLFTWLGLRGIKADERLVRSMNRLR